VLGKAISKGLKPIVVINKADRDTARLGVVENAVFDLFVSLDATDEQLDFPIIYSSARHGWATASLDEARALAKLAQVSGSTPEASAGGRNGRPGMEPLLDAMINHVPRPRVLGGPTDPFKMLVSQMEIVPYMGKTVIGRIASGTLKAGDALVAMNREGVKQEEGKVTKLFRRRGMESVPVPSASAGEIVELAGFATPVPTCTLAAMPVAAGAGAAAAVAAAVAAIRPLYAAPIDPPTISMAFSVNDSPVAGRGSNPGTQLTSSVIATRLLKEAASNIALEVVPGGGGAGGEAMEVRGRGELQLAVLIETMRREGFELSVSPPTVLFREDGKERLEPYENVSVDVDEVFSGVVIEKLALRKATMLNFGQAPGGKARIEFNGPSRGLIGLQSELKSETRGTAVLNRRFEEYGPYVAGLERKPRGVLVSTTSGAITAFALDALQARGTLFVGPGEDTYSGAIIGENSKENRDMEVNPVRAKKLTNIRSAGAEEMIRLSPPRLFSLEEAIVYVAPDELVEVTPTAIRMRKKLLDSSERERASRSFSKSVSGR
jgi:GTP-binding protein